MSTTDFLVFVDFTCHRQPFLILIVVMMILVISSRSRSRSRSCGWHMTSTDNKLSAEPRVRTRAHFAHNHELPQRGTMALLDGP